jgi:trehalose-6-phosphatase
MALPGECPLLSPGVLSCLAADLRNKIWIISQSGLTEEDMVVSYGHIENLNLAGSGGLWFSTCNKEYLELPHPDLLKDQASQIIKGMSASQFINPQN